METELWRLHRELADGSYQPGVYKEFFIHEPKTRLISAAPYRDRVVHHALTQVLEPIFERSFIFDSYACRKVKGTHAAVRRAQEFAARFPYVFKADIRKFFQSLDHGILKELVARKIKDPHVLWLVAKIIDGSNAQEPVPLWFPGDDLFTPGERPRGIPIGNQTSQFFANVFLDPLDHFVKEQLRVRGYVRYVDDILLFADDKGALHDARAAITEFLVSLRLRIHPTKNVIFPVGEGIRFLGYRVFPTHRLLVKDNLRRFRRRVRKMQREYADREIGLRDVRQRLMSWSGHASQADTYLLRKRLFATISFQRARAEKPRVARRVVQQQRAQRAKRPTATRTSRITATTITGFGRRALCGGRDACRARIRWRHRFDGAHAERALVQSPGRRARVGPSSGSSAKSTTGPAGLVGREARTPCRAML